MDTLTTIIGGSMFSFVMCLWFFVRIGGIASAFALADASIRTFMNRWIPAPAIKACSWILLLTGAYVTYLLAPWFMQNDLMILLPPIQSEWPLQGFILMLFVFCFMGQYAALRLALFNFINEKETNHVRNEG